MAKEADMYFAEWKAREVVLLTETRREVRRLLMPFPVVSVQVNGSTEKDLRMLIAMSNGKTVICDYFGKWLTW